MPARKTAEYETVYRDISIDTSNKRELDFFEYWGSLGFFDNIQMILPRKFHILFEIARLIFNSETDSQAKSALDEILQENRIQTYDKEESILVNRMEKLSPMSNITDITHYRTIYDLKKALPRELAWDDETVNIKLLTKTLLVQKFYESAQIDKFKPISTSKEEGREANRFEQKFYLLLDRSRSMEKNMRSFYSKCIVAEFLRRKLASNAKIYYRPFDSSVGSLFKINHKDDFPQLIEKVLYTTTGGTGTNMQEAVFQAIKDINYDKEMVDSEILVVTDGVVDNLEKGRMREELKNIKLNVLKIGRDLAEPNYFEMKKSISSINSKFDPHSVNLNEIKKKLELGENEGLNLMDRRVYRYILDCSEKITKDLKEISNRFIEVDDLNSSELFTIDNDILSMIEKSANELMQFDYKDKPLHELVIFYKRIYFLIEYIEFLIKSSDVENLTLSQRCNELTMLKQKLLGNPHLLEIVMRTKGLLEDKKAVKQAKKLVGKQMRELGKKKETLSKQEIKKAQMIVKGEAGKGSFGLLVRALLIKLVELIKKIIQGLKKNDNT